MPRSPSDARDAALVRMHRINRWLVAGAVVLTGLLTDVAAQAFPGRTITRSAGASSTTETGQALPATTTASRRRTEHHPLTPPAHAPQAQSQPQTTADPPSAQPAALPAPAPAPVVSGGS